MADVGNPIFELPQEETLIEHGHIGTRSMALIDDYSAMRGPCSEGFHVPSSDERQTLIGIMKKLGIVAIDDFVTKLHMPLAGRRRYSSADIESQESRGYYWSVTSKLSGSSYVSLCLCMASASSPNPYTAYSGGYTNGMSIRGFKDLYIEPDSTWTIIEGNLGNDGVFRNQSLGLISITYGADKYTIMDKNLGATIVYNNGDTLAQSNMGNMYQWGNNYGFPSTGTISNISSTQIDASGYGPNNYYSSNVFITGGYNSNWDSSDNANLRGYETGVQRGWVRIR